jgi:hypothetical protein
MKSKIRTDIHVCVYITCPGHTEYTCYVKYI